MKLVVGLGNPGARYVRTPHNIGFETIDCLAGLLHCDLRRSWRGDIRYGESNWKHCRILLAQPLTYMNLSGQALAPFARRKGLQPADLIVVLDDADLPLGRIRIRPSGRAGGHKGLQSVIAGLGTDQVARVRLGVGRRPGSDNLTAHVLARFDEQDWNEAQAMINRAAEAVLTMACGSVDEAMNKFNVFSDTRADGIRSEDVAERTKGKKTNQEGA